MEDCKNKPKVLFLVFQELPEGNGVAKKIIAQKNALKNNGLDVRLGYYEKVNDKYCFKVDDKIIHTYGKDSKWTTLKKICDFRSIFNYIIQNEIKTVYLRYVHTGNPYMNLFLSKLKKKNIQIFLEIPTYPYDAEHINVPLFQRILYFIEKKSRQKFIKYITRIITFTSDEYIFGVKTITISNGIDFNDIKLIDIPSDSLKDITCVGVAHLNFWHGYDRLIEGLKNYYQESEPEVNVRFNILGDGDPEYIDSLKRKVKEFNLSKKVFFLGKCEGDKLTAEFNKAHIAVGCLACHRKGIETVRALKNVEYAARGIPFIYSEINDDFDNKPYVYKVPPDESPIDVSNILTFLQQKKHDPYSIRNSILHLSWDKQMNIVSDMIKN